LVWPDGLKGHGRRSFKTTKRREPLNQEQTPDGTEKDGKAVAEIEARHA
jgi:hypothetical protein